MYTKKTDEKKCIKKQNHFQLKKKKNKWKQQNKLKRALTYSQKVQKDSFYELIVETLLQIQLKQCTINTSPLQEMYERK